MSNLYLMEAANLFCGDHNPTDSNHLELDELKLPDLEHQTQTHTPGGAVMAVDMSITMLAPLSLTFKLKGMNPERLKLFGLGGVERRKYTAYGAIRDKRANKQIASIAVIEGVLTKISGSAFKRGDGVDHDYEVKEVVSYSLKMGDETIYDVDFFTNKFIVGGVSQTDIMNQILRIPATA